MAFRNRPVLDRKHRPRWQDELRSQQLVVGGFALAIAVALGLFAAAAWSSYYDGSLRQVALVGGEPVQRGEVDRRGDIISAELTATYLDLNSQLGGARDTILQQQIGALESTITNLEASASDAVVTGLVLDQHAEQLGVSVSQDELEAELRDRRTLPERRKLSLILVFPQKDEGAPADAEPTEQDWAEARAEVEAIKAEVEAGADFNALAAERSDDDSKAQDGLLGWIEAEDPVFGDYYEDAKDAEAGDIVGPLQNESGWYILHVDEVAPEREDPNLADLLARNGVSDEAYRDHVRQELLRREFRDHFAEEVVARYQPQREVAQIFLQNDAGQPIPKLRVRHLLAQPIPGAEDQSTASEEQWQAALERAEDLRERAVELADEDWWELAEESDDSGSRNRGGFLGWYDPAGMATQFVPEFAQAATDLDIGEVSEPVRSEFGYHVIQVTERRTSAMALAEEIVADLREDPDSFGELAMKYSEDVSSAREGGELGWVIPYQYDAERDRAVFELDEIDEISDPVVTNNGIYIYRLLDTSEARFVPESRRNSVANSGFNRWLEELKTDSGIWLDPQFAPTDTTTAAG
jgi:peptidyl-prolyl cis-trans isomerase SurA